MHVMEIYASRVHTRSCSPPDTRPSSIERVRDDGLRRLGRRRRRHRRGHEQGRTRRSVPRASRRRVLRDVRRRRRQRRSLATARRSTEAHGGAATVTVVPLPSQYGTLEFDGDGRVESFDEKPRLEGPLDQRGLLRHGSTRLRPLGGRRSRTRRLPGARRRPASCTPTTRRLLEVDGHLQGSARTSRRSRGERRRSTDDHHGCAEPQSRPRHRRGRIHRLPPDATPRRRGSRGPRPDAGGVSSVYPDAAPRPPRASITLHEGNITDRSAMDALAKSGQAVDRSSTSPRTPTSASRGTASTSASRPTSRARSTSSGARRDVGYDRFINTGTSEIYGDIDVPVPRGREGQPDLAVLGQQVRGRAFLPDVPAGARLADRPRPAVQRLRAGAEPGPDHPGDDRARAAQARAEDDDAASRRASSTTSTTSPTVRPSSRPTPGIEGELFNIGGGEEVAIRDVVDDDPRPHGQPDRAAVRRARHRPNEIWRMYCD